jgi:hypothetical protein
MNDDRKNERFKRTKHYFEWRTNQYRDLAGAARVGFDLIKVGLKTFRPLRMPPKGSFSYEDHDGGYERFQRQVEAVKFSEEAINLAFHKWEREARIFLVATAASLGLIPALFLFASIGGTAVLSLLLLTLTFALLGTRASFRAWQISQRRMGSLRSFLFSHNRDGIEIRKIDHD